MKKSLFVALLAACFLQACISIKPNKTQPAQIYYLSPLQPVRETASVKARFGVLKIELPDYLDRTTWAWKVSNDRIMVQENYAWAEPLNLALAKVLAFNLSQHSLCANFETLPLQGSEVCCGWLGIRFFECSYRKDLKSFIFEGRWRVYSEDRKSVLFEQSFALQRCADPFPEAIIQAMNGLTNDLAILIAKAFDRFSEQKKEC